MYGIAGIVGIAGGLFGTIQYGIAVAVQSSKRSSSESEDSGASGTMDGSGRTVTRFEPHGCRLAGQDARRHASPLDPLAPPPPLGEKHRQPLQT